MQKTFDELYAKAKENESFDNLMEIILTRENILLAYRNIKSNKGSHTQGTDKKTIKDIENLTADEVVETVRQMINGKQGYRPKPVRRKEIPKPNGSKRPLGIPCIWDRLLQQCIKQVMEPICEAHFNEHSFGFRPGRSVENAIAEVNRLLNRSKCYQVIEFDIKGFFDNVNHSKLIKQVWAMGIHDKHLIYVLKQILKAPIKMPDGSIVNPKTGTPQGGIISPLLANIVLNELDWWVTSQWENNPTIGEDKDNRVKDNGHHDRSLRYYHMRKTNLKEMYIVRYADDFRIFCKTRTVAKKAKIAITEWIQQRLKLEVSPEKTKIINAKRKYTEFLGFKIKVKTKGDKLVTESHICDKKKESITKTLKQQVKLMQCPNDDRDAYAQTQKYNSMVMGIHNYFSIASHVVKDCSDIAWEVNHTLTARLKKGRKGRLSRKGRVLTKLEKARYGESKQLRYDKSTGCPILPISYVKTRKPIHMRRGKTPYTEEGRKLMHKNIGINPVILQALMTSPVMESVEYTDNRISLYSAQNGKCAITGKVFQSSEEIHCHHKIPKYLGGTDAYQNLMLVAKPVHELIHATTKGTIEKYLKCVNPTTQQLRKINSLRKLAGNEPINF